MQKIRVVIAKPGLDGHDRGAKVIARALRDAGMEVIYTGLRQTPEQIVSAALQEDADVIGLSILSGAHMHICPRILELLKEKGLSDVQVVVGGIIPDQDVPKLNEMACEQVEVASTPFVSFVANKDGKGDAANYSFVLRGYVRHWLGNVWGEYDRVQLMDLVTPKAEGEQRQAAS